MFGQASMIVDGNHQLQDISADIFAQPYDYRDIVIANDVTTLTKCTTSTASATKSVVARERGSSTSRSRRTPSTAGFPRGSSTTSDRPSWSRRSGRRAGRGRASRPRARPTRSR